MAAAVHAKLWDRAAADHGNDVVQSGLHRGDRLYDRVDRSGAKCAQISTCGVHATRALRDRLPQTSAAALLAVSHRLLRTFPNVVDAGGRRFGLAQNLSQRENARSLARQILEDDPRIQCRVAFLGRKNATDDSSLMSERSEEHTSELQSPYVISY